MGRSKAQDRLMHRIEELYPASYIEDEVYIGKLIEERGYTVKEIERELGHHMHKMFVDIVMRDSDRTVAFEYHGEQHYSLVGNMTKTTADLLMNQQLDQEKSWILYRIGIPLVAIPFDMYIDDSVIENLIDKSTAEVVESLSNYSSCECCNRLFPKTDFNVEGICKSCIEKAQSADEDDKRATEKEVRAKKRREANAKRNEERKNRRKVKKTTRKDNKKQSWRDFTCDDDSIDEYEQARKEKAKKQRKAAYKAWKESPEYQAQKEEAKRKRKEAYQKAKAERKRKGL